MNPLVDILPVEARKYLYALYALVGVVLGSFQIAGAPWAADALAVYGFVGTAFGLTAASNAKNLNVPDGSEPDLEDIDGETFDETASTP